MEKSIQAIKEEFLLAKEEEIADIIIKYQEDTRTGVKSLIDRYQKKQKAIEAEKIRIYEMTSFERKYGEYSYICGIDEVGRGPLAGPVMAAAVILPKNCDILYINDSKQLSEKMREKLYDEIMEKALYVGVGSVPPGKIDEINILQATYEAMRQAIGNLGMTPDILLNDAVTIPKVAIKQVPIIKGDAKSVSIAAASIVAKVTRDRIMTAYDKLFPAYGFASNKGYGSAEHIETLKKYGPTLLHRRSFIKNFL
ncbi:ribonuclease HII [Anaerocolumna xylanovorans]|uniref:Ribonuclease HII n=1 Tax=Anaerocolumna xylanovorans DSM 12503 TaxID=1121345 RepID=A0A1M7Y280_9FIRM|nr:ribonuclease HII [Anaerocolumna xylanovorans]SHO46058.1 RNase HII [Anaerocolumna xylanovorans DSM 12503]